jgi:hypothetical protein
VLRLDGEKSLHFEQRIAVRAPIGFYPGADRREEFRLAINGELFEKVKITGEMENTGQGDAEEVLWLALSGKRGSLTLGRFNAAFPGSSLFLVNRRVDGGQVRILSRFAEAEVMVSRPGGTPYYEKFEFAGPGVYEVKNSPVLFQSEIISLNGSALDRGRDYRIEYNTGRIYLTPRVLSDHAISDGEKGAVIRVSYEGENNGNQNLSAARLTFRPAGFLDIGFVALQEQRVKTDSLDVEERLLGKRGFGGLARLHYDSLVRLKGEVGVQDETGIKRAIARSLSGGINVRNRLSLDGEYKAFDKGYSLQGNSAVEPGLAKAQGTGSWRISPCASAEGEYSRGRYECGIGGAEETEAFGRFSFEPEKVPSLKLWGRSRETRSDDGFAGNRFLHGEIGRKFGPVATAIGGEYEKFIGDGAARTLMLRSPVFIKLYASGNEHLNFNTELSAEQAVYRADTSGSESRELRAGASGLVTAITPCLDLSCGGSYAGGAHSDRVGALEGRMKAAWPDRLEISAQVRDALQKAPDSPQNPSAVAERKSLAQAEVRLTPFKAITLKYAPLLHFRRNQARGADIFRETRHQAGCGLFLGRVKWSADGSISRQNIHELTNRVSESCLLSSGAEFLLPLEISTRVNAAQDQEEERENGPVTGNLRGKVFQRTSGEISSLVPLGKKGSAGLSAKWTAFRQNVRTENALDLDSSALCYSSVNPENELFVFADNIEKVLTAEYARCQETWEAGVSLGLLHQTDSDSSDGRKIGKRITVGLLPGLNLEWRPAESFSARARLAGVFQNGYRALEKYSLECTFSFMIEMFTFCGSATAETEKTRAFHTGTLLCFFDMRMKI